ncbi:MAG: hypothetical protein KGL43_24090 [Burkholderiales bacterium]|nr:hypothetical protein [Burkholderiales bacterium]
MTIVNLAIRRNHAMLSADSIAGFETWNAPLCDAAGVTLEDSKIVVLPHAHLAFATLGSLHIRHRLAAQSYRMRSVDQAIAVFPTMARAAVASLGSAAEVINGTSIMLVGYSHSQGRMIAASFRSADDFVAVQHGENLYDDGHACHVNNPDYVPQFNPTATPPYPEWGSPRTPAEAFELMQAQCEKYRGLDAGAPIGGRCVVAEITPEGISTRVIGDLGMSQFPAGVHHARLIHATSLSPNAATDAPSTMLLADDAYSYSTPSSGFVAHNLISTTYTNATASAIVLEITIAASRSLSLTGGTGTVNTVGILGYSINGGAFTGPTSFGTGQVTNAVSHSNWNEAFATNVTLNPGDTITAELICQISGSVSGLTGTLTTGAGSTLRMAAIKR